MPVGRGFEGPGLSSKLSFPFVFQVFKTITCWVYLGVVTSISLVLAVILGIGCANFKFGKRGFFSC